MRLFYRIFLTTLIVLSGYVQAQIKSEYPEGLKYIHPAPGTEFVSPETVILIKTTKKITETAALYNLEISGEKSGLHRVESRKSGNTYIFNISPGFAENEKITVNLTGIGSPDEPFVYSFNTGNHPRPVDPGFYGEELSRKAGKENIPGRTETGYVPRVLGGVAVPHDFPELNVNVNSDEAAEGKIFLTPYTNYRPYIVIFNPDGTPFYYRKIPWSSYDFKLQSNGRLTYWNSMAPGEGGAFTEMNINYEVTDHYRAVNGYGTDFHEMFMDENGHHFLIATAEREEDMSKYVPGGSENATIIDNHIQEFDAEGNLVFEWLSYNHIDYTDAVNYNLTNQTLDYMHMNSIAVDYDGNLLMSAKYLDSITKIDRETGNIIWRLGGPKSTFEFTNDNGFSRQHFARPVKGRPGNIMLYDNVGAGITRVVEYELDLSNNTAIKVWEYKHPHNHIATIMGNSQQLNNGNVLINYVSPGNPKAVEVDRDGNILYEADVQGRLQVYRSYKFQWEGLASKPYLLAYGYPDQALLIFNKFGDTRVTGYVIYAGEDENSLIPVDTVDITYASLTDLESGKFYTFGVKALYNDGTQSEMSDTEEVFVNFVTPGENLVSNGDMSEGTDYWHIAESGGASGNLSVTGDGALKVSLDPGGSLHSNVILFHENISLEKGKSYTVEFDARSEDDRTFFPRMDKDYYVTADMLNAGEQILGRSTRHYKFYLEMNEPTETEARLRFYIGGSDIDMFIDNVVVRDNAVGVEEEENKIPAGFELHNNYPNPFNNSTNITFSLPERRPVKLTVYNALGQKVKELENRVLNAGTHRVDFNASGLVSGVYLYKLEAGNYGATKKMIYLK